MKRRVAWWMAVAALGVGALVVLVLVAAGLALAWCTTAAGNRWLQEQAVRRTTALMDEGWVELDRLETDLVSHVQLTGLRVVDGHGVPLVDVERLRVEYGLLTLLRRTIEVKRLEVVGPRVALSTGPGGQVDLLALFGVEPSPEDDEPTTPWGGLPWRVELGALDLVDGGLSWFDASDPESVVDVQVLAIGLQAGGEAEGRQVQVGDLHLVGRLIAPLDVPFSARGDLVYDSGVVGITDLALWASETRAKVDGTVARAETDPAFGLALDEIVLSADDLEAWTGTRVTDRETRAEGTVKGALDDLDMVLEIEGDADSGARVSAWADLVPSAPEPSGEAATESPEEAAPVAWRLVLQTEGLDLQRRLAPVPEPVVLNGIYTLQGEGTSWPDGLSATVTAACGPQVMWGEPVGAFALDATVDDGIVDIQRIEAGHDLGRLIATGQVDTGEEVAWLDGRASLPSLARLSRFGVRGAGGSGAWKGRVAVDWSRDPVVIDLDGAVSGTRLSYAGASAAVASVPLQATISGSRFAGSGELAVDLVRAEQLGMAHLEADWTATWSESEGAEVEASVHASELDAGEGAVRVESIVGVVGGGTSAGGQPWGTADVVVSDLLFGPTGYQAQGGPVEMSLSEDAVTASFDLARNQHPFFRGRVEGDLLAQEWRIEDLLVAATEGRPFKAEGPVSLRFADGGVRELDAHLRSDAGTIDAVGDLVAKPVGGERLEMSVADLDLGYVAELSDLLMPTPTDEDAAAPARSSPLAGLEGEADLDLVVGYDDERWHGRVNLGGTGLAWPGVTRDLGLQLNADGPFAEPAFDLTLTGPEGPLAYATGEVPLSYGESGLALDCDATVDTVALVAPGELQRLTTVFPSLQVMAGQASGEITLQGPACNPDIRVGGLASLPLGRRGEHLRLTTDLRRTGEELLADAAIEEDHVRRVEVRGTARTRADEVFAWALQDGEELALDDPETWVSEMDVNIVPMALPLQALSLFVEMPPGLTGRLGGGLNISGQPRQPRLAGGLLWVDGRIGETPVTMAMVGLQPEEAGYGLNAQVMLGGESAGAVTLQGFIPVEVDLAEDTDLEREGLDLSLSAEGVPLSLAEGVVEGLTGVEGSASLSADVTGSLADPLLEGTLTVQDGAFAYTGTGLKYSDVQILLSLRGDELTVQRLDMTTWPRFSSSRGMVGKASASGRISLNGLRPADIRLSVDADQFWLLYTTQAQLAVSGQVGTSGRWPALKVRGDVALAEGRFVLAESAFLDSSDLELDPVIRVHRSSAEEVQPRAGAGPPKFWEAFDVELGLDLQRNLRLIADVPMEDRFGRQFASLSTLSLDAELDSQEIDLRLREGQPVINGSVEISRGRLTVFGVTFETSPGDSLAFAGDDITNPILDVTATRTVGNYGEVQVGVTGPVSAMNLDFTSDEYADQTDVLSLLLFGKPSSELADSEGQTGTPLLAAALGSMTGSMGRAMSNSLMGQIELDSDMVRVGVPLSDKLFLAYELHTNTDEDENTNQAVLEWLIRRRLYAEFITGDKADSSADLYWRWIF